MAVDAQTAAVQRRTAIFNTRSPGTKDGRLGWETDIGQQSRSAAAWPADGTMLIQRWVAPVDTELTKIGIFLTTVDAADVDGVAAIYNTSGTRLGTSGVTTGWSTVAGLKTFAFTSAVPVVAGTVYYIGICIEGTTAACWRNVLNNATTHPVLWGTAFPNVTTGSYAASMPPPTSIATTPPALTSTVPVLYIRDD